MQQTSQQEGEKGLISNLEFFCINESFDKIH